VTSKAPQTLKAKDAARVEATILEAAAIPNACTDVCMVVEHTPGALIPGTPYSSGTGGKTQFGPAWVTRGRETSAPIALFDTLLEARHALDMLAGPDSELWLRKEARRRRIAEMEAAEAAAAVEAAAEAKETKKATRGAGSSRRPRSSEKPSAKTGMRMRVESQPASLPA
jgi:hypothetical protein